MGPRDGRPWAWIRTPLALGVYVSWAGTGSRLGVALGIVGPSWVLEMDGRWAEMGPLYGWALCRVEARHGWALVMDWCSPWMGHGHGGPSAWMGPGNG